MKVLAWDSAVQRTGTAASNERSDFSSDAGRHWQGRLMKGQQPQEVGGVGSLQVSPRRQPGSFYSLTRRGGAGGCSAWAGYCMGSTHYCYTRLSEGNRPLITEVDGKR